MQFLVAMPFYVVGGFATVRIRIWMSAAVVTNVLAACSGADRYASQELSLTTVKLDDVPADELSAKSFACVQFSESQMPLVNLIEIASVLRGGDFKKQEFETTDQFKVRLASRIKSANQRSTFKVTIFILRYQFPQT